MKLKRQVCILLYTFSNLWMLIEYCDLNYLKTILFMFIVYKMMSLFLNRQRISNKALGNGVYKWYGLGYFTE